MTLKILMDRAVNTKKKKKINQNSCAAGPGRLVLLGLISRKRLKDNVRNCRYCHVTEKYVNQRQMLPLLLAVLLTTYLNLCIYIS